MIMFRWYRLHKEHLELFVKWVRCALTDTGLTDTGLTDTGLTDTGLTDTKTDQL
jgi:hypothetical protein